MIKTDLPLLIETFKALVQGLPYEELILGALLTFVVFELVYTFVWHPFTLGDSRRAERLLKKAQRSDQWHEPRSKMNQWLHQYLLGQNNQQGRWTPLRQNGYFLLNRYPEALTRRTTSPLRFAPALLTALGVLGTFVGITLGMPAFDEARLGTSSQEMVGTAQNLLGGMQVAFHTSLMGLAAAGVFMLLLPITEMFRNRRQTQLRKRFGELTVSGAAAALMDSSASQDDEALRRIQREEAEAGKASSEALTQTSQLLAEKLDGFSAEVMGDQIAATIQATMSNELAPILGEIRDELKTLREIKQDNGQDMLRELVSQLRSEVLEPMSERIDQSTRTTERAAEAVETLHRELGGIAKDLAQAVSTLQQFQNETLHSLQDFANQLSATLGQFQTETKGVLESIATEINAALAKSIEGMASQREAFKESASQAATSFQGIRDNLEQALAAREQAERDMLEQQKQAFSHSTESAATTFREIKQELQQALETRTETERQMLEQQRQVFEDSANQAATSFQGIRENLEQALAAREQAERDMFEQQKQAFSHSTESAATTFREIKQELQQALETRTETERQMLEQQRQVFDDSAAQTAQTFRTIRTELEQALAERARLEAEALDKTRQGITEILGSAEQVFASQSSILKEVGENAGQLMDNARERLQSSLQNIDEALNQSLVTAEQQLDRFRVEYQNNLQVFFNSQNTLLEDTLGQQREGLSSVVQQLDGVFREEYDRRCELNNAVSEQFAALKQSNAEVQQLAEAVGITNSATFENLKDAARSIGQEVGRLEKQYASANQTFQEMITGVPKALDSYLTRSHDSQVKFCAQFDEAAAAVHNRLAEAAEILLTAEQERREADSMAAS